LLSHAQANPYDRQYASVTDASSDITELNPDHLPSAPLPPSYAGPLDDDDDGGDAHHGRSFVPQDTTYQGVGAATTVSPQRRPQVRQQDLGERPSTEWGLFADAKTSGGDKDRQPPFGRFDLLFSSFFLTCVVLMRPFLGALWASFGPCGVCRFLLSGVY